MVSIPNSQMRKVRLREVKRLAQRHPAKKVGTIYPSSEYISGVKDLAWRLAHHLLSVAPQTSPLAFLSLGLPLMTERAVKQGPSDPSRLDAPEAWGWNDLCEMCSQLRGGEKYYFQTQPMCLHHLPGCYIFRQINNLKCFPNRCLMLSLEHDLVYGSVERVYGIAVDSTTSQMIYQRR